MRTRFLFIVCGILGLNASNLFSYSGMSAGVAQSRTGWNVPGNIVVAVMDNDAIISENAIYSGGDGYCPRFSPDGSKVAFTAGGGSKLKICNIDGSNLKEYPASGWEVSWLRSGVIWIHGGAWSSSSAMNKYDAATGAHLGSASLPSAMQQFYVSANGKVGAGTGSNLSVFYCTINGDSFGNFIYVAGGCSSGPTPEGDYMLQNTWPHKVFNVWKIPEKNIVATKDIRYAGEVGLNDGFIWNHQLMAGQCNVCVLPVGTDNGGHQLDGYQYPCFYDIDENKLIWMSKTNPGGNLLVHPYDFFKGSLGPSLSLSAASTSIDKSASTTITATLNNFDTTPQIQWSATGGAVDPSTGTEVTFTPGAAGVFTITATAGDVNATVTITAVDYDNLVLKLNCGGGDVGEWTAAGAYASGGEAYDFGTAPSTAGVEGAAPAEVYQTVYHSNLGSHRYEFGNVPDGAYTVRLHFYDMHDGRTMSFLIEGETVIEGYDPPAQPVVREFDVTVDDGDGLLIECLSGGSNDVFLAGLEIIRKSEATITGRQSALSAGMPAGITRQGKSFRFDIGVCGEYRIDIINMQGATVMMQNGRGRSTHTWTPQLTHGVYSVRIVADSRTMTSQLVILR